MSKQESSVAEELTLSEEIRNHLHIEDFVWVEMAEAQPEAARICNNATSDAETNDQSSINSCSGNVANIAQSLTQDTIIKEGSDESDNDTDLSLEDEYMFEIETEYVKKCTKSKDNPLNPSKNKYPNLYWLKIKERGIHGIEKRQLAKKYDEKLDTKEQKNELLPKMKFDTSTTKILEMAIKNRYLGRYKELIGTGKNSVVFYAYCHRKNCMTMPFENAVKIYKTSKDEEKNKIIYKKVLREFDCLSHLYYSKPFDNEVPTPVRAWKNVIVMRFIGFDHQAAQSIEELTNDIDETMYNAIINSMDKFYNTYNVVHGNLTSRSILFRLKRPFFIGWSHSVKRDHPQALAKLMKDCLYITEFYEKRGVKVKSAKNLFLDITQQEKICEKLLEIIEGKNLYDKYDINPNRRNKNLVKTTTANNRFK